VIHSISALRQKFKSWRKERRRLMRDQERRAWQNGLNTQETFEKIYAERVWGAASDGSKFYSGDGSKPETTASYEVFVVDVLRRYPHLVSMVDIGCGDFQVSGRILKACPRPIDYMGCDIARTVVAENTARHARPGVSFQVCNAIETDPPKGDVVCVRQVFQHLSNTDICSVLERLKRIYKVAIITEAQPIDLHSPNLDIASGNETRLPINSGVCLDAPPFNLTITERIDTAANKVEVLRTTLIWFADPPAPVDLPRK
jgi:SAM-dependent methyltransferase